MYSVALNSAGVPFSWGSGDGGALARSFTVRKIIDCDSNNNNDSSNIVDIEFGPAGTNESPHPITGFRSKLEVNEDGQIFQAAAGATNCHYQSLNGQVYMSGTFHNADNVPIPNALVEGHEARLVAISLPSRVVSIHSGPNFAAAIAEDGTLFTWGESDPYLYLWFTSFYSHLGNCCNT
jgi:alpha-tubulin suppressor-like RCC1 family protein